ncbi:MAG: hypothetical protein V1645_04265 [archaeon]
MKKKRGYLGIDESNHGRYPEIFVAVYSEIPSDVVEHDIIIPKVRKRHGGAILPILKSRSFKHILIPERYGDLFGGKGTSLVVVSEFIRYFDNNLDGVIVDGEPKWEVIEGLEKMLHPTPLPRISFVAKGDTKFGIVNLADHVANLLHRYYSKFKHGKGSRYSNHLLTPDLEGYRKVVSGIIK